MIDCEGEVRPLGIETVEPCVVGVEKVRLAFERKVTEVRGLPVGGAFALTR